MKIKKIFISVFTCFIVCITCTVNLCAYSVGSFGILNEHYAGTYYQLGVFPSWITIREGGCDVHIVYDKLENCYINAVSGYGYINQNHFMSSYSAYIVVDSSGDIIQVVPNSTYIQGTVYQYEDEYIDININGVIYEKSY